MTKEYINKAIGCSIDNCANHSYNEPYCGIKKIQIGTHEANPNQDACTDCKSFELKK